MKTQIETAMARMVVSYPFYASIALRLPVIDNCKTVRTAATDGKRLLFNREYTRTLTPRQAIALVAHEVLHVAHQHVHRRGGRDIVLEDSQGNKVTLWNIACDYVINLQLKESGFDLHPNWLLDHRFCGMSEEQVYARLEKELKRSGGGRSSNGQESCDELLEPEGDEAQRAADRQEIKAAVLAACKMAKAMGTLPGAFKGYIEECLHPKLQWHEILRRFFTNLSNQDFSWNRPNKRYLHTGFYLPSRRSTTLGTGVLALDTSGSVADDSIAQFMQELDHILSTLKPERTIVAQCDADVGEWREYYPGDALDRTVKGMGGTDFRPVFDAVNEAGIAPEFLVYFTDGYGKFPEQDPGYPVLWVMITDVVPPWGEVIRMGDN